MNRKWLFAAIVLAGIVSFIGASDESSTCVDADISGIIDRINHLSMKNSDKIEPLTSSFASLLQQDNFQVYRFCSSGQRTRIVNCLVEGAKRGNGEAAYTLARLTERGVISWKENGQAKPIAQSDYALDFYQRAVQYGHEQALYDWEAFLQKTDKVSAETYKKEMFDVAAAYYHKKQYDQAIPRFVISEIPESSNFIGDYFKLQGNTKAALGWYGKAAREQYKNARVAYWHIVNQYKREQNIDVVKAVYKDSELQYKIGCMLEKEDEKLGYIAALPWYYAAAELGNYMAKLSYLQVCYSLSKKNRDIITPHLIIRYLVDMEQTSVLYEGPIYIKLMEKLGVVLLSKGEWGAVTYLKKAADYSKKRCENHENEDSSVMLHNRCLLTLLGSLANRATSVPEDVQKDCTPYAQELLTRANEGFYVGGGVERSCPIQSILNYSRSLCEKYASEQSV